jgi:hypothetical protein
MIFACNCDFYLCIYRTYPYISSYPKLSCKELMHGNGYQCLYVMLTDKQRVNGIGNIVLCEQRIAWHLVNSHWQPPLIDCLFSHLIICQSNSFQILRNISQDYSEMCVIWGSRMVIHLRKEGLVLHVFRMRDSGGPDSRGNLSMIDK